MKNIWKFCQKYTKFEHILKKGRWMCATIACNKLLGNALLLVTQVKHEILEG